MGLTMSTMLTRLAAKARAFLRAKRGNVAMIFGLAVIPLAIAAGAGLDYARAMLVRQQMGEALDAAALAIGSTSGVTQSTAQTMAQQYFNANYQVDQSSFGTPSTPTVTYNSNGSVDHLGDRQHAHGADETRGHRHHGRQCHFDRGVGPEQIVGGAGARQFRLHEPGRFRRLQDDGAEERLQPAFDDPAECRGQCRRRAGVDRALRQGRQCRHRQCQCQLD